MTRILGKSFCSGLIGELGERWFEAAFIRREGHGNSPVGNALVGNALVGNALVGNALVSNSSVGDALVCNSPVGDALGDKAVNDPQCRNTFAFQDKRRVL